MNRERNNRNNLPDFGDRYSANRTKDRQRREQQRLQQGGGREGGQQPHQQGQRDQHQQQQVCFTVLFPFPEFKFFFFVKSLLTLQKIRGLRST